MIDPDFDDRISTDEEIIREPVTTVAEAIDRMRAINAAAPQHDGLAEFNKLYTVITCEVADWLRTGRFADFDFLDRLDVAFANRYFDALRAWGTREGEVPRVWKALLERRGDRKVAPIQFAVAGVNAHINYDLAAALVTTCEVIEAPLGHGEQRLDYDGINTIFAMKYKVLRDEFTDGLVDQIDEGFVARALDFVNNFVVEKARDEAWESAERLVIRRSDGDLQGEARVMSRLDRHFGLVAWGLLMRGLF
ncbi:MAG: hypothetical protein QOH36_858 [Actinomycetota bacterium]|nr:hypothetical protein [Actinomycetota bacterium]MEA2972997.1 hypothetical protein [Actinomycetota bacterium]